MIYKPSIFGGLVPLFFGFPPIVGLKGGLKKTFMTFICLFWGSNRWVGFMDYAIISRLGCKSHE